MAKTTIRKRKTKTKEPAAPVADNPPPESPQEESPFNFGQLGYRAAPTNPSGDLNDAVLAARDISRVVGPVRLEVHPGNSSIPWSIFIPAPTQALRVSRVLDEHHLGMVDYVDGHLQFIPRPHWSECPELFQAVAIRLVALRRAAKALVDEVARPATLWSTWDLNIITDRIQECKSTLAKVFSKPDNEVETVFLGAGISVTWKDGDIEVENSYLSELPPVTSIR